MIKQPIATPLDLRDTAQGGKIYPVDPQAVARMKAILAENDSLRQAPLRQAQGPALRQAQGTAKRGGIKRNAAGVDTDLAERAEKLRALREAAEAKAEEAVTVIKASKISEEEILALYRRYVMERISTAGLAKQADYSSVQIHRLFKSRNFPARDKAGNYDKKQIARVCEVLGVRPGDVPQRIKGLPPSTGSGTASPSTGSGTGLDEQLAALTALMDMAQAKRIQISRKIRLDLVAEIEL